ncbi:sperm-associated antigen 6-like [Belonocnema kinseyi]|uniref:sperm-associated antigen 6-like n=1 Tax=Belonocnema kinseyi TaxID=2817044 RepID=UPI00143CD327|nr:sperm-associated antigen 6-like [Belonocnema kinseyi]
MTARICQQVFEQYQKSRMQFVQTVADLASKSHNVECLERAGVLETVCPLINDIVPTIRQTAVITLGRLASHDIKIAQAILRKDVVPCILKNLEKQNKFYKKAALFILRSIAKHSAEMAAVTITGDGLNAIIFGLEDFDPGVKEAAAWAVGYVARHNTNLAQTVIDAGAVPLLVLCLQEPDMCLKQISASALCDISKHTVELAQAVVDSGAISILAKAFSKPDAKLKRQVLSALGNIAKHSIEFAEFVVEAEIFPNALIHMAHPDENVVKAAAVLTREVCKHTFELAELIVNTGGIAALVELIATAKSARVPGLMAIGYIAGHSDQLALAVIESQGLIQLVFVLEEETEDHVTAITVWALGQIGKHTAHHSRAVAEAKIFPKLLSIYTNPKSSEDLKSKCKMTLKQVLQKCTYVEALEPLLHDAPSNILKYIIGQFSKILPNDARARRLFVSTGGLKKVQEIRAEPGSTLSEYITVINCCYPEEIIRYYSPGFSDTLLEAVDEYQPRCASLFAMEQPSSLHTDSSISTRL